MSLITHTQINTQLHLHTQTVTHASPYTGHCSDKYRGETNSQQCLYKLPCISATLVSVRPFPPQSLVWGVEINLSAGCCRDLLVLSIQSLHSMSAIFLHVFWQFQLCPLHLQLFGPSTHRNIQRLFNFPLLHAFFCLQQLICSYAEDILLYVENKCHTVVATAIARFH